MNTPADARLMTATHLNRYELIETLGRGSMGVVYKARDPLIDRLVAIKTISYAGLTSDEARDYERRFFLEAKSAGRMSHPNIVTIHDVGHYNDQAYIAMEFLSGQSLRDMLDSGVVPTHRQIAKIAHHVATGLAYAHAHGVIHRDIKPANIMVPESGQVKITDFGIALLPSGALTTAGTAVGSPKYMSPEQVLGHKSDARSDIFSLGAVLYEMLTGKPAFGGEDLNAILYQVLNTVPPLPSDINAALPPGFDRIVARALAKDPDKRYQSAAEMAADLRNYKKLPGLMQGRAQASPLTTAPVPPPAPVAAPATPMTTWRWALVLPACAALALGVYLSRDPASQKDAASNARPAQTAIAEPAKPGVTPAQPAPPLAASAASTLAAPPEKPAEITAEKKVAKPRAQKSAEPQPVEPAVALAPPAPPKEAVKDWKAKLYADMAACESLSFFSRVACQEKARWKHCEGHWGSTDICSQAGQN